ncbi:MAG: c-type cytochrome [Terricaulis sp.]|nr:c-type cytochrome [Terricaulis sp.]
MRVIVLAALSCAAFLGACAQEPPPLAGAALIERGDYLVNSVVLCGDCHTPRLETMALDESRALQGGVLPPGPGMASIAPELAGIPAHYSEEQFIAFLQTGVRPDGSQPMPPMPPYRLNEEDARAVSAYIATLPKAVAP